jgi:hypothetical protein
MGFLSIGIGFIGSIFGNLLGSLFGIGGASNVGSAISALGLQAKQLASSLTGLGKLVTDALSAIGKVFDAVWKFLSGIWDNYIKKFLEWLKDHVKKLYDWLHTHIKSLLDHLKKWKKWYDDHILKQQLRLIAMIQRVRQFLGILRLFHVKWAIKLDNSLADLQNRIEQAISIVRGNLNGVINWLNAIYNPVWLAGRLHVGGFFVQELDAHLRGAGLGGLSNWGAASDKTGNGKTATAGVTKMQESMHQDTISGTGKFSEFSTCGAAAWKYQDSFGN